MGGPKDTPFTKIIKNALQRGVPASQKVQTVSEGGASKLVTELGSLIAMGMMGLCPS